MESLGWSLLVLFIGILFYAEVSTFFVAWRERKRKREAEEAFRMGRQPRHSR